MVRENGEREEVNPEVRREKFELIIVRRLGERTMDGYEAHRLQPRWPAAVRGSAWLGRWRIISHLKLQSTSPLGNQVVDGR